MDDYTANEPSLWLAQNDPSLSGAVSDPSIQPNQPQEAGASDQYSETAGGDYENGVIPQDAATPGSEPMDPSQVAPSDAGVPVSGPSAHDQAPIDAATTPPPPSYGGEAGTFPPGGDSLSNPGVDSQGSGFPQSGDPQGSSSPMGDGQMATTAMPNGLGTSVEPPLGLLPIIVFGLATVIGIVIYLSRRGKNWAEIGDSIRDDGGGVSRPESRIVTQFSEIQDIKGGTKHTQSSMQVSGFE
jgi:hypothetical protein